MPLLNKNKPVHLPKVENVESPELVREMFPFSKISRTLFDGIFVGLRPADPMFITDTTFRDGQQASPPYTVQQISAIFDLLYKLGGRSGLIRASEFFLYTKRERQAVEECRKKGYKFPKVTAWIRATIDDLKLARDMEMEEVGMLTSVSDYHIYLKMGLDRQKAFDKYVQLAEQALEWGIVPRCHFEDVTRADIYGFCIPLAAKLMDLSRQSGLPVKIRLCDTMGFGIPYPGACLPRSVGRIVRAFTDEAGVPGQHLEWHGHNDFHKGLINASTAWLYGCGGVNGTLLGFGERTGNTPIEAMVVEYISLTGKDDAADTTVIGQIADYFSEELNYAIPEKYPFVGRDFNATTAGIHVDGNAKNMEIYNIFDTEALLGKAVPIIISERSGRAGVAYWINDYLKLKGENCISKAHPAVADIYKVISDSYEKGRTINYSNKEMLALTKRYLPSLFPSELERLRKIAKHLSATVMNELAKSCEIWSSGTDGYSWVPELIKPHPFIQYVSLVNTEGKLIASSINDSQYEDKYKVLPLGYDFSGREWFAKAVQNGKLYVTDIYQSQFTGKLILSVSIPVLDAEDTVTGVLAVDIQLEEILLRADELEAKKHQDQVGQ